MKKNIKRRDFLNGAAIAIAAGSTLPARSLFASDAVEQLSPTPSSNGWGKERYPPTRTGIRGSHDGSFEVAHDLAWRGKKPAQYSELDEDYDLIIVGGGISGLAAAYLYQQQAGADKKILILDNHDDFGGHAKRNEFQLGDRTLLGPGGSFNLEHYSFSDTAARVISELGIDLDKLGDARDPDFLLAQLNSPQGYFLNEEHYGQNKIIQGHWPSALEGDEDSIGLIKELGLPSEQHQRLLDLISGEKDLLDDLSLLETKDYIAATSYEDFLTQKAGLSLDTVRTFESFNKIFMGLGIESVSVETAFMLGYPGANSVGYTGKLLNKLMDSLVDNISFPVFPDGNASVARLLVHKLIPAVSLNTSGMSSNAMESIVTDRFDYSQLDRSDAPVRIRLNSTAVNVKNIDDGVEVSYVQNGKPYKVWAGHSILACYNGLIPHLCPELPESQKESLKYGVKVPLVMTSVLIRNGAPVYASGPVQYQCPGSYFSVVTKAPPVSLGDYRDDSRDDNPLVLVMLHAPAPRNSGQQNARDLYRLGRHKLYTTTFETYEKLVKDQLTAMFGANGFDAEQDIEAITVNRWSHGYSYEYNSLFDPEWEEGQAPHELGRAAIGRISIANSDSEAQAYLHSAIDAAARAVNEIIG